MHSNEHTVTRPTRQHSPAAPSRVLMQGAQWDAQVRYFGLVHSALSRCRTVLDVGCGVGSQVDRIPGRQPIQDLRGPGRAVVGMDLDPEAAANPWIDEFRLLRAGGSWPVTDASVDLVVSTWVLEHVEDPPAFVREVLRVLRPGGVFAALTISRYSALATAARVIDNDRHARIVTRVQPARAESDVFPTVYRMNSPRAIRALFARDFEVATFGLPATFEYLHPWPALSRIALHVERVLPPANQGVMIVMAEKRQVA